jgi:hypothetical protein
VFVLFALAGLFIAPRASAYVYWSSNATGLLRAANDGSQLGFFVSTPPFSDAVAIDGKYVYWTSSDGRIGRANLNGTDPNPNFITGLPDYLPGLAVNGTSIYWSGLTAIGRAGIDGTGADPSLIATNHATGLALDGQHLYWGENEIGAIGRADLDGKNVDLGFVAAPGDPCSVAVDPGHVYWSDATGNSIGRANLNGSGVSPKFIDTGVPIGCGIAVFQSHIYFGTAQYPSPSSIARANVDGSGLQNAYFSLGVYGGPFVQMAVDALGPPPAPPSNAFRILGQKRNRKNGTALVKVKLPGPGVLALFGKQVRRITRKVTRAGTVSVPIRPRRRVARHLRRSHRLIVVFRLRFTPTGGDPATKSRQLWLVKAH